MEMRGIDPRASHNLAIIAKRALYHLSYTPILT